ncbi:DUF6082 family protein [Streptomyces lydicus]|uniref:DUF6082 family protein n=1 Tax=Streptomyces lydicus TaxID=47763 RepID=UPI0010104BE6|nr:DUF6082 family protein [Streptomyces lydicus]MCZ1008441.1 DUF6082 family protein [Streptomyces lydicus]
MKLTTAVLTAGAAVSFATAAVGVSRLRQAARHQVERNEIALTRNQLDWLTQISTNADLAKDWAPDDMSVGEYMRLMKANQVICIVGLRDRLGFIRDGQMPFYASEIMNKEVCRRYWSHFGDLRVREAEGDGCAEEFTEALRQAARAYPQVKPAA